MLMSFPVSNGGCARQDIHPQEESALNKLDLERSLPFPAGHLTG